MGLYGYEDEIDFSKLKYVLYVRKSTEDESRQVKSIQDQIKECKDLASPSRLGLRIVKILQESKSAKKPNQRPIFRQMLDDLKKGTYDGIIAWHPDRLARNMLEGGEIIDLIDQRIIKDLKFVTHHFTHDANGKMLLGMAFVLSKQYSDKLSQDVTRGVRSNLEVGKSPVPKYGYYRDESGLNRPDEKHHEIICATWRMRREGISIEQINKYVNEQGFYRIIKSTGKKTYMTEQKLSDMFKDSFYYGVLNQAKQTVDLRDVYDFVPAVSESDFITIQEMTYRKIKPTKPYQTTFYPLRMMIFCSFCNQPMRVAPSTSETKESRYLYARCDTRGCLRKKKSIRTKVILDFVYEFLKDGLNFTETEYREYLEGMKQLSDDHKIGLRGDLTTKRGLLKHKEHEASERSLKIIDYDKKSPIYKENEKKITELTHEIEALKSEIAELEKQLVISEGEILSIEQFANLSKNPVPKLQAADAIGKDIILRKIFANFTVDEVKVASYQLAEPFAALLKHRKILFGRGERT
ncbi:hypothetical protein C4579_01030 [Candidatus Microgenomates bacterium]|nr:MAG: hypothetical protein C4579_01030 [Candidatus Microgenomates bacterium]